MSKTKSKIFTPEQLSAMRTMSNEEYKKYMEKEGIDLPKDNLRTTYTQKKQKQMQVSVSNRTVRKLDFIIAMMHYIDNDIKQLENASLAESKRQCKDCGVHLDKPKIQSCESCRKKRREINNWQISQINQLGLDKNYKLKLKDKNNE